MLKTKLFVACILFAASPALAESPVDGTWKMDAATARWSDKPAEAVLADGSYDCVTCNPRYKIAADGRYQSRPGSGIDESSVQIVNDRTVKFVSRKDGKLVGESLITVSADGKTRTVEGVTYTPNGLVTRSQSKHRRVGEAPAGAHAVSGKWLMERLASASDEQMLVTFKAEGDKIRMNSPDGYAYLAQFGGPAVVVDGDRGKGTVQVRQLAGGGFEEINRRADGTVINVTSVVPRTDGRLAMKIENKLTGGTEEFQLVRQ